MNDLKLVFGNVRKNISDYLIYFLTLSISISLFYAFNSISDQPAFTDVAMTTNLIYNTLNTYISILSYIVAMVLAFLIIYANNFLLKRRKKELGIYMLLGMKKRRIARVFAGETFCIGAFALLVGLAIGIILSQGIGIISLKLFALDIAKFDIVLSQKALLNTIYCFAFIFLIVILFNTQSVSKIKLIELLTAGRKNEYVKVKNQKFMMVLFITSITLIIVSGVMFEQNGILPTDKNYLFQISALCLVVGTLLLFYSGSIVLTEIIKSNRKLYLNGINSFVLRQISSKLTSNFFVLSIVCGLLTITICVISTGISMALTMNELSQEQAPYNLNVTSNVSVDGDSSILDYLNTQGVDIDSYAENVYQISVYEADISYKQLLAEQSVDLWKIDEDLLSYNVSVISISDFNNALQLQGRNTYTLNEDEYYLNCNYRGTIDYMEHFYEKKEIISLSGAELKPANDNVLSETYVMTSVGNNDRGTLIVPDSVATKLSKDLNVLLVQYNDYTNSDEVIELMLPIGLDDTKGYRYAERDMMYDMFYGLNASVTFICCYLGIVFLLICVALLSLKQLTETTDNLQRYTLLRKIGTSENQLNSGMFIQVAVFFVFPLAIAFIYAMFGTRHTIKLVTEFMNIHVSTNIIFTSILLLLLYGIYFIVTYLSCKKMIEERKEI